MSPLMLSRGARLCESIIRNARARRGGQRECGRPYLARRLGCSVRQVSRYVRELREAGRLEVVPPRRERRRDGWRSVGVNRYRLTCAPNPAPHVTGTQTRRSRRGDTHVTPSPRGDWGSAAPRGGAAPISRMTAAEALARWSQLEPAPRTRTTA